MSEKGRGSGANNQSSATQNNISDSSVNPN